MTPVEAIKYLTSQMGSSWVQCEEPESLAICLDEQVGEDMASAIKSCIMSDLPWADPFVFENVVDGICGNPVIAETLTIPPMEEICAAVNIMGIIKPDNEYSDAVMKYICCCAMHSGLVWLPEPLLFAAEFMVDTDTGLQFMVKKSIEASGWPVYHHAYNDDPVGIQLAKLAAISEAFKRIISG